MHVVWSFFVYYKFVFCSIRVLYINSKDSFPTSLSRINVVSCLDVCIGGDFLVCGYENRLSIANKNNFCCYVVVAEYF